MEFINYLTEMFEKTFIRDDRYKLFLEGFKNTLVIAVFATLLGVIIGLIVAVVKVWYKQYPKNTPNCGQARILVSLWQYS